MTSDSPFPGYNDGTHIRYTRTTPYGYIATNGRYQRIAEGDPNELWLFMRAICRTSFYPYPNCERHRMIYDGEGTQEEVEEKRRRLLVEAMKHDKDYPGDMWATMTIELGKDEIKIDFYNTIESLLKRHFKGSCIMEASRAGMVRIVWATKIVRIFHLSPAGIQTYKKMFYEVPDSPSKNPYIFQALATQRGLMYNPTDKFLKHNGGDYGYSQEGYYLHNHDERTKPE